MSDWMLESAIYGTAALWLFVILLENAPWLQ